MAIAYRSVFTIIGEQSESEKLIFEQFNEWITKDPIRSPRNLNRDLYQINSVTRFNPNVELVYFEHKSQDGSRTLRARLIENKSDEGRWISTLTIHFPKRRNTETLVMYEGDAPIELDKFGISHPQWVGRPGLVRRILDVTQAFDVVDSQIEINQRPDIIEDEYGCEEILDKLCDPDRSISIALVASKAHENPVAKRDFIEKFMHDSMGNVATYILSNQATRHFNNLVGQAHGVFYDNLRLFVPDFDPAVEMNARLHPIVKMQDVNNANRTQRGRFIASIARKQLLSKPLSQIKREFSRIESNLIKEEYEILISGKKISDSSKTTPTKIVIEEKIPNEVRKYIDIYEDLRNALGVETFTKEDIDILANKIKTFDILNERLIASYTTIDELKVEVFMAIEERDDQILIGADATAQVNKLRDHVKWLRNELSKTELASQAWLEVPQEERTFVPNNFEELLLNLHRLPNISFTGADSLVSELDATELGTRSSSTWNELCGLNDYCEAKKQDKINGGIMQYIDNLPNGYRPIGRSNFRPTESESVLNNVNLRNQRVLPVPQEIEPSGKILMDSHITVGKRLHIHFYDDVARSGKIYIGRIGFHLDTKSTN